MPTDPTTHDPDAPSPAETPERELGPAAQRALAEAAARRAESDRNRQQPLKEIAGRDGPEPTRYGDWEINGLISDF